MAHILKKSAFEGVKGPVVTIVMDGVGVAPEGPGNAVKLANTPTLDFLMKNYPLRTLKAHGTGVGRGPAVGRGYGQLRSRTQRFRLRTGLCARCKAGIQLH